MARAFDLARQRESPVLRQRSEPGVVAIGSALRGVDEENLNPEDYAQIQASTRSLSTLMFQFRCCGCANTQTRAEDAGRAAGKDLRDPREAGVVAGNRRDQSRLARHRASAL